MKVINGSFGRQAASNLSSDLRALADAVDRGEIVDFIAAYVNNDEHEMMYSAPIFQCIFLATLLHRRAVDNCITGES